MGAISRGSNLLRGAEVASSSLRPVNMDRDDDTYVRDSEQAELHHACTTERVCQRVSHQQLRPQEMRAHTHQLWICTAGPSLRSCLPANVQPIFHWTGRWTWSPQCLSCLSRSAGCCRRTGNDVRQTCKIFCVFRQMMRFGANRLTRKWAWSGTIRTGCARRSVAFSSHC